MSKSETISVLGITLVFLAIMSLFSGCSKLKSGQKPEAVSEQKSETVSEQKKYEKEFDKYSSFTLQDAFNFTTPRKGTITFRPGDKATGGYEYDYLRYDEKKKDKIKCSVELMAYRDFFYDLDAKIVEKKMDDMLINQLVNTISDDHGTIGEFENVKKAISGDSIVYAIQSDSNLLIAKIHYPNKNLKRRHLQNKAKIFLEDSITSIVQGY